MISAPWPLCLLPGQRTLGKSLEGTRMMEARAPAVPKMHWTLPPLSSILSALPLPPPHSILLRSVNRSSGSGPALSWLLPSCQVPWMWVCRACGELTHKALLWGTVLRHTPPGP